MVKRAEHREGNVARSELLLAEMIVHGLEGVHDLVEPVLSLVAAGEEDSLRCPTQMTNVGSFEVLALVLEGAEDAEVL